MGLIGCCVTKMAKRDKCSSTFHKKNPQKNKISKICSNVSSLGASLLGLYIFNCVEVDGASKCQQHLAENII